MFLLLRRSSIRCIRQQQRSLSSLSSTSRLVTHASANQAPGKGREVALALNNNLTRAPAAKGGVDGITVALSLLLSGFLGLGVYVSFTPQGKEKFNSIVKDSNSPIINFIYETVVKPFADPISDKLLPDFPPFEPGQMPPRTLVIDFEDTLCHLEWSREFGWRAVKRPGVDQFLIRVATAGYEIVVFSSGLFMFLEPMTISIDPRGAISHRLYREATTFVGNKHIKDLSRLNRDLKYVIAVDDDPQAVEYHPENLICVKPFVDKTDVEDRTLLDLAAILEDIAMRDIPDARVELARLRGIGHGEAIAGFKLEREEKKKRAEEQRNKGLVGFVRGTTKHAAGTPPPGTKMR